MHLKTHCLVGYSWACIGPCTDQFLMSFKFSLIDFGRSDFTWKALTSTIHINIYTLSLSILFMHLFFIRNIIRFEEFNQTVN